MNKTQKIETGVEILRIVAALAIAYAVALTILFSISENPIYIIKQFIIGPFSSPRRIGSVINQAIPFATCGLAMCFMYAVNKFNLIIEGVFMLAGCMATYLSLRLQPLGLSSPVYYILLFGFTILVGVLAAAVPALLDIKFKANVVVVSLMLNSIIFFFAAWMLRFVIRDSQCSFIASEKIPAAARMAKIFGPFRVQSGLIVSLICVVIVSVIFFKTTFGYKMRLVGSNPKFAKVAGISIGATTVMAQLLGGGFAAIAGTCEILGNYDRFQWTAGTGHGFDGLLVAVLARKNPILVPIAALFLAYIRVGADVVNATGDIPVEFITVIQGIIILLVAAESFMSGFKNKLIFKQALKDEKKAATPAKSEA